MPTTSPLVPGKNKLFHHPKFICTPRYRIPHSATPSDHLAGHVYPCSTALVKYVDPVVAGDGSGIHSHPQVLCDGKVLFGIWLRHASTMSKTPHDQQLFLWDMAMGRDLALTLEGDEHDEHDEHPSKPSRGGNIAMVVFDVRGSTVTVNISSST